MIDIDAIIRRQSDIIKYSQGYSNDIVKASVVGDRQLVNLIRDFQDDASERDIQALIRRNTRNKKVKALLSQIDAIIITQQDSVKDKANSEMRALAEQEVTKIDKAIDAKTRKKPSIDAILKTPILGASVTGVYTTLFVSHLARIKSSLISAFQNDQNPIDTIKGTRDQKFKNGLLYKRERDLRINAETQAYGVVSNARQEVYRTYEITQEVILATLDHRTCVVCGSYDGDIYKVGEGVYPPFHPRCRCIRSPYVQGDVDRPFVEDDRSVKDIPKSERKGKIGITDFDYDQFFERQTEAFKRRHLGKTKYEAYKAGKLSLDDMVNGKTNKIYTLDDLDLIN